VGKQLKFAVRVAISILLVVLLLVYVVDLPQVWRILKGFQPTYLLLAVAAVTLDRALMTYKWTLLLGAQGYRLPLLRGMVIYCAAMLWGSVLPGTVGADAIRAVLVMRRGLRGADAVASIIVERLVGFVAALVLGIASWTPPTTGRSTPVQRCWQARWGSSGCRSARRSPVAR
jgi:uncharacterized protein (TIRG00374 family)